STIAYMIWKIAVLCAACAAFSHAAGLCEGSRDLRFTNGHIVTMDSRSSIVNEVTIQDGKFDTVGPGAKRLNLCTKTVDLHGRTAIPGLIDNHNHIILLGFRPGHDTRLELAGSIEEVQAAFRERARNVPAGEFLTAMGGWNPAQFTEKRLPTLA